jgi:hypothetical protein
MLPVRIQLGTITRSSLARAHPMNRRYTTITTLLLALLSGLTNITGLAAEDHIVTRIVEGAYADVASEVRTAIEGKGINIAHVMPASDMLHRTAEAFGYSDDVYLHAETYEFCSARISQKLSRINPDNIVLCPFTISVYVVKDDPEHVRLSYRVPIGKPGTGKAAVEVEQLIESILNDATW